MNPEIRSSLDDMLLASAKWKDTTTDLHCFYPMRGAFADGRLMLVGRALYGWNTKPFKAFAMTSEEMRKAVIDDAFEKSSGEGCPIWHFYQGYVDKRSGYNIRRSNFWSVGEQVIRQFLTPNEQERWPSYLYWTNLYKLSLQRTGNPPWSLRKVICEASVKIMEAEIEALQPKRILFLTGQWWACHFLENNSNFTRQEGGSFPNNRVHQTGFWKMKSLREAAVVVADHPERKKRSEIFDDIKEAFQRLGAG